MQEFLVGRKVTYIPVDGAIDRYEHGIIKSKGYGDNYFVVFHCAYDWDNYDNYTGQLCSAEHLRNGWL